MAKIRLTGGFKPLPEGTYIFKVSKVEYKEDFGKMTVTFETKDGKKLTERYNLLNSDGSVNDGAMAAFSAMAEAVLDVSTGTEIDEQDLLGKYLKSNVVHNEDAKGNTYAHLGYEKEHVEGFDEDTEEESAADESPVEKKNFDLRDILG
jgi:hypothetical protein